MEPLEKLILQNSLSQVEGLAKISQILNLPTELFNPYRFLILNDLYRLGFVSFSNLKVTTGTTDGNLASHLRFLENEKLIDIHKSYAGRYPKRFYFLTTKGTTIVEQLILGLDHFLEQIKNR